jgi:hypothetical protein
MLCNLYAVNDADGATLSTIVGRDEYNKRIDHALNFARLLPMLQEKGCSTDRLYGPGSTSSG